MSELDTIMEDLDVPGTTGDPLDEDGPEVSQVPAPKAAKDDTPANRKGRPKLASTLRAEQLEAKLLELEAENEALRKRTAGLPEPLPDDPNAIIQVRFPMAASGVPIAINGKKYQGVMDVTRAEFERVQAKLGINAQINLELVQKRGTEVSMNQLAATDADSRIQKRRQGRHVLSCE